MGSHITGSYECIGYSVKILIQFLDPDTADNTNGDTKMHVRTIDIKIFITMD